MLFGKDTTQSWNFFGLGATQTIGLLAIIWILGVTFFSTRGMDFVAKVGSIGGVFTIVLNVIFCVASVVIWIADHGALKQPITSWSSFTTSPNPDFSTLVALLSFVVYAIFAYAGMESLGGVMGDIEKPEKTFPRAVLISTLVIALSYSLMIFMWGISTNWQEVIGNNEANLGNITYVLMNNLGVVLGQTLGLSAQVSQFLGVLMTRFAGLGMFIGYVGAFFILVYSPIKSFILGSDPKLWPKKNDKLKQSRNASLFNVASSNDRVYLHLLSGFWVSTSCPYLFLVGAFPFFKQRTDIERPFEFFKSRKWTWIVTAVVLLVLVGGIIFTCVEPILRHEYDTAFWTIIGPVFFGVIAWLFYHQAVAKGKLDK